MAIDSPAKRRAASSAGVKSQPVVTPDATKPAEWRGQAAGLYSFFLSIEPPTASITSIVPDGQVVQGTEIDFTGDATPGDFPVDNYFWESSIDGIFSNDKNTSYSLLSLGSHTIRFWATDTQGNQSNIDTYPTPLVIIEPPSGGAWIYTPINQFVGA